MEATIKLGDIVFVVTETHLPDMPLQHTLIAMDTYTGTCMRRTVTSENIAIEVLRGFIMSNDGPSGLFVKYFDHKDFRP